PAASPARRARRTLQRAGTGASAPASVGRRPPTSIAPTSSGDARAEKTTGTHSAPCSKALTECARTMSTARKATFDTAKSSTQERGSAHQLTGVGLASTIAPTSFALEELRGHRLDLGQLGGELVEAMPLDEVGPPHERPMLGGPAEVVPEV